MKTLFYIALFITSFIIQFPVNAQKSGEMKLKFNHINVNNKGTVYLVVYNKKEDFMTQNYFKSSMKKVETASFSISFESIPFGTYAVSAYHDINGNEQMDFNENGMPQEDYAMSGTPNPMGPPNWEQVKFEFKNDGQVVNVNF